MTLRHHAGLLAFALLAPLTAPPAAARDRVQIIAGWRVVSGPSGDGGHAVRLTRRTRLWAFDQQIEYWHGNGGVSMQGEFRRGSCGSAGESGIVPWAHATSRRWFDRQLAAYLSECPLPRREAAALRASLARAWPAWQRQVRRARAAMDADARAIENYGR